MDDPAHRPEPSAASLRWDRILPWRARLAAVAAGRRGSLEDESDGVSMGGQAVHSETVGAFVAVLYDEEVVVGFDWPGWMERRGSELTANHDLLRGASLEDGRRLLAAVVRADRFNEGTLLGAIDDGLVDAILGRIEWLITVP